MSHVTATHTATHCNTQSHMWISRVSRMNESSLMEACCSVLQRVLQCVVVCCSVLQCVAVCCSVLQCVTVCCSVLQCVAVCCSVCCCVLQCVLQCVAVCCSMSRVPHMNKSCHTYEWVMSHIWTSHVTHMNESCHTYNESCHTYEGVAYLNESSMTHSVRLWSDVSRSYAWHEFMTWVRDTS